MSLSGWRPAVVRSPSSRNLLPALGPRMTSSSALPGGRAPNDAESGNRSSTRSSSVRPSEIVEVVSPGRSGDPASGSRFRLDGDLTTAGRHPDSDIFLDDVTVSRRHAEFYRHGARFTVRDVGSLNGTYVNRERIEEAELTGGDEVQIGKFRMLFLTSQDLGPNPSAPSADRRGRGAQDYA